MPRGRVAAGKRVTGARGGRPSELVPAVDEVQGGEIADQDAAGVVLGLAGRSIRHLEMLQSSVEKQLRTGMLTGSLSRESAGVARSIAALQAQVRQDEKLRREKAAGLSMDEEEEVVRGWLEGATPDRRRGIVEWLQTMESESSLLGG